MIYVGAKAYNLSMLLFSFLIFLNALSDKENGSVMGLNECNGDSISNRGDTI